MKNTLKILFAALLLLAGAVSAVSQPVANPVAWSSSAAAVSSGEYDVTFTADIKTPWYMYDLGPYDMFPNQTVFTFEGNEGVELVGDIKYGTEPIKKFDDIFEKTVGYFKERASFVQRVKVTGGEVVFKAAVEFQVCNDESCLAPAEHIFSVELKGAKANAAQVAQTPQAEQEDTQSTITSDEQNVQTETLPSPVSVSGGGGEEGRSLWSVILEAILWGFAALLTPCVFPMVPVTVSFFLKANENKSRARGRFMASAYGISIVALYTVPIALIILITYIAGGEVVTASIFNWFATHWLPNIIFAVVFLIFAASFFGAFEIRMPGKLVNKSESNADRGGMPGVFFMALTLVLVSFSCTGPIVGSILIKSTQGHIWEPVVTMLAFSVAFSIPFAILAFFPVLMGKMPKSGGWMNSVKVTLGFLELALGLKFLSVADQVYHWGILDREVYLALWIVIFTLLGFYLLGKIRFKYDTEVKHMGIGRLALVIIVFSFVVYMIPGMWGAPLKAISGYIPPLSTQDFVSGSSGTGTVTVTQTSTEESRYGNLFHLPYGLTGSFELEEGLEKARQAGKPLFVNYTGLGCVNCREMESKVWSDAEVLKLLRDDYVIVSLYADDRTRLPENEWVTTSTGRSLKTIGAINSRIATTRFGVNTQPSYIILDGEGNMLMPARGYNTDIKAYREFLKEGLEIFRAR